MQAQATAREPEREVIEHPTASKQQELPQQAQQQEPEVRSCTFGLTKFESLQLCVHRRCSIVFSGARADLQRDHFQEQSPTKKSGIHNILPEPETTICRLSVSNRRSNGETKTRRRPVILSRPKKQARAKEESLWLTHQRTRSAEFKSVLERSTQVPVKAPLETWLESTP